MVKPANFRLRRRILNILVCGILLHLSAGARAAPPDVYWSGFAFQGDFDAGATNYPISTRLAQGEGGVNVTFDDVLRPKVGAVQNDSFRIVTDQMGQLGPDAPSSIALGFVLDRETVSVEQFGTEYKLLVELSAQALFFDFKESSVLASYPITLQYVHAMDRKPEDADAMSIIQELYLGGLEINVFDEFVDALSKVNLNLSVNSRIRVTEVNISPTVVGHLPTKWRENVDDFATSLAQEFGRSLSMNQDIPVLPYSKGYAIRNRMSTRFADGAVYTLKLPESDYEISLDLKKIVKIEFKKVAAGTSYVYGTYLQVTAKEPLSGRIYIDRTIKNGATKVVPAGQTSVDDWPAYQDSLSGLIEQFTTALSNPDKEWVDRHIGDTAAAKDLIGFSKVVMSCR